MLCGGATGLRRAHHLACSTPDHPPPSGRQYERVESVVREQEVMVRDLRRQVDDLQSRHAASAAEANGLRGRSDALQRALESKQMELERAQQRLETAEEEAASLPLLREQVAAAADLEGDVRSAVPRLAGRPVRASSCPSLPVRTFIDPPPPLRLPTAAPSPHASTMTASFVPPPRSLRRPARR